MKIVVALVLFAHGIGHVMGPLQVLNVATVNPQWNGDSWALGGIGTTAAHAVGISLWVLAAIGFSAAAAVVMGWLPADWWQPVALASSIVSLAAIALFPLAFPTFSTIGAAVVDLIVIGAVAWADWTPADVAA